MEMQTQRKSELAFWLALGTPVIFALLSFSCGALGTPLRSAGIMLAGLACITGIICPIYCSIRIFGYPLKNTPARILAILAVTFLLVVLDLAAAFVGCLFNVPLHI